MLQEELRRAKDVAEKAEQAQTRATAELDETQDAVQRRESEIQALKAALADALRKTEEFKYVV